MECMEYSGSIRSLARYPEKKMRAVWEDHLILREDFGIEGDFHADGGKRQISLLTVSGKEWMKKQEAKGFCFQKYKENILLEGICLEECRPGDLLICDGVILEVTEAMKKCYPQLCSLSSSDTKCLLPGCSRFARVKKGGIIRTGSRILVVPFQGQSQEQKENME